jgi:hypothetical protein
MEIVVRQRKSQKSVRPERPLAAALGFVNQGVDNQAKRILAMAGAGQGSLKNLPLEN